MAVRPNLIHKFLQLIQCTYKLFGVAATNSFRVALVYIYSPENIPGSVFTACLSSELIKTDKLASRKVSSHPRPAICVCICMTTAGNGLMGGMQSLPPV